VIHMVGSPFRIALLHLMTEALVELAPDIGTLEVDLLGQRHMVRIAVIAFVIVIDDRLPIRRDLSRKPLCENQAACAGTGQE